MSEIPERATKASSQNTAGKEYLAFKLGSEEYGIDILKVQEIRGYDSPTHIANSPEYMKGVVTLRGTIVPIIDMRIKLNLGVPTYDQFTVVIVLNIGHRVIGIVVDSVSDVTTLLPDQIRSAPEMRSAMGTDYITGIGTLGERMLILVDIEKQLADADIGLTESSIH